MITTDGPWIFTFTEPEVAVAPVESVTRAEIVVTPDAVGVHANEYTPPLGESTVPTTFPAARNSTLLTAAGALTEAVAVRVKAVPRFNEAPAEGEVRDTTGTELATTTLTADEVTTDPLESVTRTVSEVLPAAEGVHCVEYEPESGFPGRVAIAVEPARN